LTVSLEQIFRNLHKDSLQRRIRRAEREELTRETGCSEELLNDLYRLVLITRRRHQLPPQPLAWFRNLVSNMGENLKISVARKGGVPVAALLTLRHRTTAVYKYGCSDERFHHLAAIPFLFWRFIEESKSAGAEQIDFGRSDLDQDGLTKFKDHFGTTRRKITYWRYPKVERTSMVEGRSAARRIFSVLPDALSRWAGSLLYRHMG
jgi:lipid II:glycine glycyltransferase (peptidoglycan interpeptide bridge formation enzyme)